MTGTGMAPEERVSRLQRVAAQIEEGGLTFAAASGLLDLIGLDTAGCRGLPDLERLISDQLHPGSESEPSRPLPGHKYGISPTEALRGSYFDITTYLRRILPKDCVEDLAKKTKGNFLEWLKKEGPHWATLDVLNPKNRGVDACRIVGLVEWKGSVVAISVTKKLRASAATSEFLPSFGAETSYFRNCQGTILVFDGQGVPLNEYRFDPHFQEEDGKLVVPEKVVSFEVLFSVALLMAVQRSPKGVSIMQSILNACAPGRMTGSVPFAKAGFAGTGSGDLGVQDLREIFFSLQSDLQRSFLNLPGIERHLDRFVEGTGDNQVSNSVYAAAAGFRGGSRPS